MKHIMKIGTGVNIVPLSLALKRNPTLWNKHSDRTRTEDSPHREADDIWVRYAAAGMEEGKQPHDSVWYPSYRMLPQIREIAFGVMGLVSGERLGGVLITRIPPGGKVSPHQDHGWHAEYYSKFAVQVESHPQQAFCYEDGQLVTAPGDIYWFDNQQTHWVINDSPVERITLIFCIRTDQYLPKE